MNWWVWHAMFWIPHNYLSCTWEIPWTFQIWNGCKMQLIIVRAVWICLIMVSAVGFFQRLQYSDMSINQCQSGIDDAQDIPSELFEQERVKLGKKGIYQPINLPQEAGTYALPIEQLINFLDKFLNMSNNAWSLVN